MISLSFPREGGVTHGVTPFYFHNSRRELRVGDGPRSWGPSIFFAFLLIAVGIPVACTFFQWSCL